MRTLGLRHGLRWLGVAAWLGATTALAAPPAEPDERPLVNALSVDPELLKLSSAAGKELTELPSPGSRLDPAQVQHGVELLRSACHAQGFLACRVRAESMPTAPGQVALRYL